uniref:Macro domain-containing protein n=1 Tax=Eptatretus burgeri TaxID=7764 RepID=A0A8C4R0L5_EPTBU
MSCPEDDNPEARSILVEMEFLKKQLLLNKLQKYFQSNHKSEGGECDIRWNADETKAIVTFKKFKDAERVLGATSHSIVVDSLTIKLNVSHYVAEKDENHKSSKSGAKGGSTVENHNKVELEGTRGVSKQKGTVRGDNDTSYDSEKYSDKIGSHKSKNENSSQFTPGQQQSRGEYSSEVLSPPIIKNDLTEGSSFEKAWSNVCGNGFPDSSRSARKENTRPRENEEECEYSEFFAKFDLPGNRTLHVVNGDILEQHVNVIINVANEDLNHVEGLALNMVNRGGEIIQEESAEIVRKIGPLKTGSLWITRPGKLHCQKIFHVVAPKWSEHIAIRESHGTVESLLIKAVKGALEMADKFNFTSIAIPAFSFGIFGFPLQKCADTIVDAVIVYCKETQNNQLYMKEIRIVNNDVNSVKAFERAIKNYSKAGLNLERRSDAFENAPNPSQKGKVNCNCEQNFPEGENQQMNSHSAAISQEIAGVANRTRIVYRCGDIFNEKVDVIVNMTAPKMDLKKMRISNRLLAMVGPNLQTRIDSKLKECADQTIINIDMKDRNLNCKELYNVDVPQGEQQFFERLHALLKECLQSASQSGYRSIAFLLLPSEELLLPSEFPAHDIIRALSDFVISQPLTSLQEIYLISENDRRQLKGKTDIVEGKNPLQHGALDQNGGNDFEQNSSTGITQSEFKRRRMMNNRCSCTTGSEASSRQINANHCEESTKHNDRPTWNNSPSHGSKQREFEAERNMTEAAFDVSTDDYDTRSNTKSPFVVPLPGNCTLHVIHDDILKQNVDVVVNAANEFLQHIGGLARAIVEQGGQTIQDESSKIVKKHGPIETGSMVMTEPGKLSCKKIFHVVGPIWREHNVIKNGERIAVSLLKKAVKTALLETDNSRYKSIAIPAISSGIFGFPLRKCAETIVAAIQDYCEETKNNRKNEINIYIADMNKDVIAEVCHAINGDARPCKHQSPSDSKEFVNPHSDDLKSRNDSTSSHPSPMGSHSTSSNNGIHRRNDLMLSPRSRNDFLISNILVKTIHGDITQQHSDAIVNSTDHCMSIGGVSAAILQAAGEKVKQEFLAKKNGTFSLGCEIIHCTTGGSLNCKVIIHVVGLFRNTLAVQCVVHDVLELCKQNAITSVSFPFLGTGIGGMKTSDVRQAMLQGIESFTSAFKQSPIQLITLVSFDVVKK